MDLETKIATIFLLLAIVVTTLVAGPAIFYEFKDVCGEGSFYSLEPKEVVCRESTKEFSSDKGYEMKYNYYRVQR